MAQPWPAWVQTAMPIMDAMPRSASSSTIVADLPPSSRKRRFMVAAPFSMMRLPTAVDPVKEMSVDERRERELLADEVVRAR